MYRIGIDIGGTFLKAGVVSEEGELLVTASRPTQGDRSSQAIIGDIAGVARDAVQKAGLTMSDIAFVGAGCPGTVNQQTGIVEYSNNLNFTNVPFVSELTRLLGKPVRVENDANAAALGEWMAGAAKGKSDCICITLGTGVGSGILLDGHILSGMNGAGGEIGHTVIVAGGEPCTCGRRGCWEAYASVTGLIRQTKAAMQAHPESAMWQIAPTLEQVNGRTAWDAMRQGDAAGTEVVDRYIEYVGVGLTNVINIFQPEIVCIGGAISKEGDRLLQPLVRMVERERYSRYSAKQTVICRAKLGNDAGIIGAAFLDKV